jgi:hypothetical protein
VTPRAGWLTGAQLDSEAAQDDDKQADAVSPVPAPTSIEPVERSLADLQQELANNESRLQALGVQLPARNIAGGELDFTTEKRTPTERAPAAEPPPPGGGATTTKPDDKRPAPSREDAPDGKGKQGRKVKAKKKAGTGGFAPPPPEPDQAKSTPLAPNEQPQLDAATRCSQVCSLSDITCELGAQICELAQRHADNAEYEQACVRATEDCDAAQEACDACTQ